MTLRWKVQPSTTEIVFIVLNYVACIPVIFMVGLFRYALCKDAETVKLSTNSSALYHYYCVLVNTTTIEGWEKNKVATLIRRGRIEEVWHPLMSWVITEICNSTDQVSVCESVG